MEQIFFNSVIALAGFLMAWLIKVVWDALSDLKRSLRELEKDMHELYVRKDHFRDAVQDLRQELRDSLGRIDRTLNLIFEKLDCKEDK